MQGWRGDRTEQAEYASRLATEHYKPENVLEHGCPRGWVLSRFSSSVGRYRRRRLDDGARVPSLVLDRTDDPLVLEAVMYLEIEEEGHHSRMNLEAARDRARRS